MGTFEKDSEKLALEALRTAFDTEPARTFEYWRGTATALANAYLALIEKLKATPKEE